MKSLIVKLILPVFLVMFALSTYIPAAEKNPQNGNDPTKSEQVQDRKRDRKRDKNCVPKKDGSGKKNKMQKKGNGNKKGSGNKKGNGKGK